MANAGKTLTFPPDNAVSDHQTALNEKGLDFGGNFLYVYGCDRSIATNSWECPYPDQNNHKWTQKVVAIIPPCIDSDGGQDQTVQGKTTGMTEDGASFIVEESAAYTDSCVRTGVGQSVVKEFYCEANNDNIVAIKSTEIACEEDETCFLGKCEVYEVPPETI